MSGRFVSVDRDTPYLLPESVQDWLPQDHLARFVVEIVEQLDLRPIVKVYRGRGSEAYHPAMMLSLLFYGYATGIFSSRRLERATYDSVACRFITANEHPDHDSIAQFRKRFLPHLRALFVQILVVAQEMGVLKVGKVSLDGTKVQANASKHHALSWQHACKIEEQLKAEVAELLCLAEQADAADVPDGMSVPEELARLQERLAAIALAKAQIEARAAERFAQEKALHEQQMAARAAREKDSGKKPGGKAPTPPEAGPRPNDQVNLTDPDSRIMPVSDGGFEQSYNAQAAVDTDSMLVVEQHVSQCANDKHEVAPTLDNLAAVAEQIGKPAALLADNGYCSASNVSLCETQQVPPFFATKRDQHHPPLRERFSEPPSISETASPVDTMRHRLATQVGRAIYALRKQTIEPVFGIIKEVLGFRRFSLRGFAAAGAEWTLVCIAYNLKRLHVLRLIA
jgi:transposase